MKTKRPLAVHRAATSATIVGAPNPQGKGAVGFLLDWDYSSPRAIAPKQPARLLADYFTSLLVLSAAFKFKPAFETDYYLYRSGDSWALSLISPHEWNTDEKRREFVGACTLHRDSTWSIEPSENVRKPGPVSDALAAFYDGFMDKLDSARPLEQDLPIYEAGLPYYQRLFASALSRSLRGSMRQGDQFDVAARLWRDAMPADAGRLIAAHVTKERDD